jgi:hypothetical protein
MKKPKPLNRIAMKNLRITLIAAILTCAMLSLAGAEKHIPDSRKIVPITFERAMQIPGLPLAMMKQLDPGFLSNNQHYYIMKVTFEGNIYEITGTYDQWFRFFSLMWKFPAVTNKPELLR